MIHFLSGTISEKDPPRLVIDVGGVGFVVYMPLSLFPRLGDVGSKSKIITRLIVKEESLELYGFMTGEELALFDDLTTVPGIGPKTALNLMSRFSVNELLTAIENQNDDLLATVPGIGKKTAAKIILELKGKIKFEKDRPGFTQAIDALVSLGLTRNEAIDKLRNIDPNLSPEEMVRKALQR